MGLMLTMLVREVAMIGKPVQPFGAMFYAGQLRGMYIMLNMKTSAASAPSPCRDTGIAVTEVPGRFLYPARETGK